jgi:uncharacterized protein with FMN-binding domain/ferredoxin
MKRIQTIRLSTQILSVLLTILGFFINFQFTLALLMLATFFGGAYYCGWICPYGSLQESFSKLGRKIGIKKRKMPAAIQKYLKFSRYLILLLSILLTSDFIFGLFSYDPRANFSNFLLSGTLSYLALMILISFGMIALFFDRPFCNYFCIEGAKYGLISSFRVFTIKRNESSCVNCKKCDKVCPMNIEVSKAGQLHSQECINCFECVSHCPIKNTLTYGKISLTPSTKKRFIYSSSIALIVITSFLIYSLIHVDSNNETDITYDSGLNSTLETLTESGVSYDEETSIDSENIDSESSDAQKTISDSETINDTTLTTSEDAFIEEDENIGAAAGIADGVYSGSARGFKATMYVDVTVANQLITNVEVTSHKDDAKWFNRANNSIPDTIIQEQSTDIDVVSGATFSSNGIINAAADALSSAK